MVRKPHNDGERMLSLSCSTTGCLQLRSASGEVLSTHFSGCTYADMTLGCNVPAKHLIIGAANMAQTQTETFYCTCNAVTYDAHIPCGR